MLARYYQIARSLTSKFYGTFDKVIGDAVLAVFNYPPIAGAATAAVRYAIDLVRAGRAILDEFAERSTAVVETGIRVGIATGDVWPINVGQQVPQVSFIGDPLNLAARLQHQADVNGIVTCRSTWFLVESQTPTLASALAPHSFQIPKGTLSGISTAINAQRISPEAIEHFADA
jgi:class 3 adenylate cyclase